MRFVMHSGGFIYSNGWSRNDHLRQQFLLQEHPGKGVNIIVNYDKQNPGFWNKAQSPGLCCGACNKLCFEETVIILAPVGAAIVKSVTDSIIKPIFKQLTALKKITLVWKLAKKFPGQDQLLVI